MIAMELKPASFV